MLVQGMVDDARQRLVTIGDDRPLIEAAGLLTQGAEILVVVEASGRIVGLITKSDVVRQMSVCDGARCRCAVSTVMTQSVVTCTGSDSLQDVSDRMKQRHLKNIPVLDQDSRPIAVLTARSILRVLLSDAEFEEAQLVDYVKGVGYR
ncbi:CBS domain-containing protein [Sphingomonas montana]|uniref:CBS domain-containing protein n=1 Tax=Sphingomonas montana TaxID=1843236 RepID=UPI00096D5DA5|nr:CBS domain-containing protein [Sphingomonas montana]